MIQTLMRVSKGRWLQGIMSVRIAIGKLWLGNVRDVDGN